ncbi:MAG: EamA family transporter [Trueperaceae bacterium]|nr:EamA family transporter [Trueperaceae bacterium]
MTREGVGLLLVLLAAVLWGLLGVFTAGLLALGMGAIEIAFWRATFAGAAFALHATLAGSLRRFDRRSVGGVALFAAVGVTAFYVAIARAVETGGIAVAFVLLYTAPAWVTLLAGPVLGERPGRRQWAWVAAATLGVALVATGAEAGGTVAPTPAAVAWGLAAGLGYASYYLLGKRLLHGRRPEALYAVVLPLGALGLAPFVAWSAKPPVAWTLLAALALVSTYVAYLVYGLGLKRARASLAVVVATVEPVVAGALAWVWFGERLGAVGALGAVLVLAAAVAVGLAARRDVAPPDGASAPAAPPPRAA